MSLASLSPQRAGSTHLSTAGSPVCRGCPPDDRMFNTQELEQRLIYLRDSIPTLEDSIERWKAEAQRDYDEIIALGGRPTRPIQHYPLYETTTVDGMEHYRDDYEKVEVIFEVDDGRVATHWADESDRWIGELDRWRKFKEAQQLHNQSGRSQLELELETTDAALTEALSNLSNWQDFQFAHQKRVHEAEKFHEHCQQAIVRTQGAMGAASNADATLELQERIRRWISHMRKAQEKLEASQKELMWVKSQWMEVIAEAFSSIATAPKLQKQLEAKLETQTNAIYRCLQQEEARPSHAIYAPSVDAGLPQRIQHWILESSAFETELWDWRIFMAWRRRLKDAGRMDQDGRKVLSQGDSCVELFEDLVKYQREKIDRANSWVNCWRHRARQLMEARKRRLRYNRPQWPAREENDYDDDDDDEDEDEDDDFYDETEVAQAKKALLYASHAEEKVSVAAKMLEESKQKLRDVLAESDPAPTAEHPAIQRLPTPPKSQSPESLPESRRPSKVKEPAGNDHRRMANTNIEQHALPPFSSGSNRLKEHDDDIEMSDHAEEPNQADSEDTVMADVENPPNYSPSPLTESQPRTTANKSNRKLSSSRNGRRRSKKERARKGKARVANINAGQHALPPFLLSPNHMEEHNDGIEMLEHTEDLDPVEIKKEPNQADPENIVMSDVDDNPSHSPPSPPESQSRATANNTHRKLPSSSSQSRTPRKTRSSTRPNQVSSGKILKKPSKNKPPKKTKDFTDQQTTALLDIALTSSPSSDPTSLGRNEPESYTKPTANTNHRALPSPRSPISTSRKTRSSTKLDQASSAGILKKSSKNKPLKKPKAFTEQQTMALLDASSTSYPSTGPTSLGRDIPESSSRRTANTNQGESPAPKPQTPTSSYCSTGPTSLGRDIPESYQKPTTDTDHSQLSPPSSQTPTSSFPLSDPTSLGRNMPESYPKPSADTDQDKLPAPSSQTTTSSCPSTGPTLLGRNVPESYPRPNTDHYDLSPSSSQTPTSSYPSAGPTSLGRNMPESYSNPTPDTDHEKLPAPTSHPPMSRKTRLDKVPPGKILKKPSKNKPLKKTAKVFTEASNGPTPPRRSERLKRKAVATSNRPV